MLITGESGLGKSELGLEPDLAWQRPGRRRCGRPLPHQPEHDRGRCPELLQNLLEVRGIGLLDIKAIFGGPRWRKMRLKLIVHLVRKETMERDYERMPSNRCTRTCSALSAQGRDPGRRRPQHRGAGRGRGAQHHPCSCAASTPTPEFARRQREAMERGLR